MTDSENLTIVNCGVRWCSAKGIETMGLVQKKRTICNPNPNPIPNPNPNPNPIRYSCTSFWVEHSAQFCHC